MCWTWKSCCYRLHTAVACVHAPRPADWGCVIFNGDVLCPGKHGAAELRKTTASGSKDPVCRLLFGPILLTAAAIRASLFGSSQKRRLEVTGAIQEYVLSFWASDTGL